MAETTQFGHDQLAHLLADYLLEVPKFQRSYSWDDQNVDEYLADLADASARSSSYFMGTVVFALPDGKGGRRQIVDGQQRLATTAVLLIAVRDLLQQYGKTQQAAQLDKRYLRGYDLESEADVERLILSPDDQEAFDALLEGRSHDVDQKNALRLCYDRCQLAIKSIAPSAAKYKRLMDLVKQLESNVQVLVAVASDLPEAYVIFETLNDRGADLTTADLLKNFLFSKAKSHWRFVEERWVALEASFDRADELVKFIRYEYASRNGFVQTRRLYRAIQSEVSSSTSAKAYIERLTKAQKVYAALKDPGSSFWSPTDDVQDAILAYRRFGFESSFPVLLAAFASWDKPRAGRLLIKMAKWSVRGQIAGRIGAGVSEDLFGIAAQSISTGVVKNQTEVRAKISRLIPNDAEFEAAFTSYGALSVARAKYLLAMLERACEEKNGLGAKALEWHSQGVTIEHIMAESHVGTDEDKLAALNTIGNLALLEKRLNKDAGSKHFVDKISTYLKSDFELTKELTSREDWSTEQIADRTKDLAFLACRAWPAT